jgi:hypothetical protein
LIWTFIKARVRRLGFAAKHAWLVLFSQKRIIRSGLPQFFRGPFIYLKINSSFSNDSSCFA